MDLKHEPSIRIRLHADWRLETMADGPVLVARSDGRIGFSLPNATNILRQAGELLVDGTTLAHLRTSLAKSADVNDAVSFLVTVQRMLDGGFLEYPLVEDGTETAVLVPQWKGCVPALDKQVPAAGRQLDRFTSLRRGDDCWLLESPLCGLRMRLVRLDLLDHPLVRRALAANGFLENMSSAGSAERQNALKMWEFHDLIFHVRHRRGWTRDPAGATCSFVGEIDAPPAERPAWPGRSVDLPTDARKSPLSRLLDRRRSLRRCDDSRPISVAELGTLLDRCARVRRTETESPSTKTLSPKMWRAAPIRVPVPVGSSKSIRSWDAATALMPVPIITMRQGIVWFASPTARRRSTR